MEKKEVQIPGGYVLLPRIMREWEIMKMAPINRELWFYLLINVLFADYKNLKRGQGFFRFQDIQEHLSWYVGFRRMQYSKPQITKSLRRLKNARMIETMKATQGIIITVCNYDYYQDALNYEGNNEGNENRLRRKRQGHNINKEGINKNGNKGYKGAEQDLTSMNYKEGLK